MKKLIVAFRNSANALKNDDDLEIAVVRWMSTQDTVRRKQGIYRLVPQYDTGLNSGGKVRKVAASCIIQLCLLELKIKNPKHMASKPVLKPSPEHILYNENVSNKFDVWFDRAS